MAPKPVVIAFGALVACAGSWRPAVIVEPTEQSRAALAEAVGSSLGAPVTLAADALTRSSVLIVERTPRRDAAGLRVDGRSMERPERFRLLVRDGRCVLLRERDGARLPLPDAVVCAPGS